MEILNHSCSFIRCYPLPKGVYGTIRSSISTNNNLFKEVFDSRYLQRERIKLADIVKESAFISHKDLLDLNAVNLEVYFYIHKSETLILIITFNNLPNQKNVLKQLQDCRPGKNPELGFHIKGHKFDFWSIYDWFAVNFLCRNLHSKVKKQANSVSQTLEYVKIISENNNGWAFLLAKKFGYTALFATPCIFGSLSCITLSQKEYDILSKRENEVSLIDNSRLNIYNLKIKCSENAFALINRNNGIIFNAFRSADDAQNLLKLFSLHLGFLLLVRHILIMLGQTAAIISDTLFDNDKNYENKLFSEVSSLKSKLVFYQDELNDINIWNSPELVNSSRIMRESIDWSTNNELKVNQDRVIDLLDLTESISRTHSSSTRKFISVILAVVSVLNLMQLIPVVNDHIIPHMFIIGPPLSLILIITALIAIKIHKNT